MSRNDIDTAAMIEQLTNDAERAKEEDVVSAPVKVTEIRGDPCVGMSGVEIEFGVPPHMHGDVWDFVKARADKRRRGVVGRVVVDTECETIHYVEA